MAKQTITSDPLNRVTDSMKAMLKDKQVKIDIHCHVFNFAMVPDGFLGIRLPLSKKFLTCIEQILHKLNPWSDTDTCSNLAYFINFGKKKTMEQIAEKLFSYYPQKTIFCPLLMDMQAAKNKGIKGKLKIDYIEQIKEMERMVEKYPDKLLPFIAIDPNRKNVYEEVFLKAFEEGKRFFGVKIYPPLGYLPSNPQLMRVFADCEKYNIPVTTHCSGAIVRASGWLIKDIEGLREKDGEYVKLKTNKWLFTKKAFADFFNHPKHWCPVLEKYPHLRLNLAHFGSAEEWQRLAKGENNTWPSRIFDLMKRYPHVYADFSMNLFDHSIYKLFKERVIENQIIRERALYGSDYYMLVTKGHFRSIKSDFETAMGDKVMEQIAVRNTRAFLGLDIC